MSVFQSLRALVFVSELPVDVKYKEASDFQSLFINLRARLLKTPAYPLELN